MAAQIIGISRSISACKRCRKKKIKCSQDFPRCMSCSKAGTECVSLDPATGREIPRSYLVHLENRIEELESYIKNLNNNSNGSQPHLQQQQQHQQEEKYVQEQVKQQCQEQHNLQPTLGTHPNTPSSIHVSSTASLVSPTDSKIFTPTSTNLTTNTNNRYSTNTPDPNDSLMESLHNYNSKAKNDGTSRPTSFSGNGISFSKLMFAAVHFKGSDPKDKPRRESNTGTSTNIKPPIDPTTSIMSSFSKNVALLPPKIQALDFLSLYFDQSNSQLPIFHREEFLKHYFIPIYGEIPQSSNFASKYTSIDLKSLPKIEEQDTWYYQYTRLLDAATGVNPEMNPFEFSEKVSVPKRFKKALYFINMVFAVSSSTWHLQFPNEISDNFKNAALVHIEEVYSSLNRLEALQAMLCLTLYSLMRPCVPGVWYLLGSSLRLCVDLGLHNETTSTGISPFIIDIRRRLFWCCYSLDRQICVYLGRPFGIPEESIKVPFPSILDDNLITESSTLESLTTKNLTNISSYKHVAITMFKIRQLQAEIQSILYENRELPRRFNSLTAWLIDISTRLNIWRSNTPKTSKKMNCDFTIEFFDLNYYHARIMLHGLAPARFILTENDFIGVAEAAKGILLTFHALWNRGALNYTWAATQNVFMSGMSFLYAVFHSDVVKNATSLKDIRKFMVYAEVILNSLVDRCDAAGQCLEVLTILTRAVAKLKYPNEVPNNKNSNVRLNELSTEFQEDNERSTSPRRSKLPSADEVKTLQPGGHMTGSMRRLIVSIPALMNAEEKKLHPLDSNDEDHAGDRKRLKREPIESDSDITSTPTPNVGSLAIEQNDGNYDNTENVANGIWNFDESDLERFFDEVRKVESPESVRSFSHMSSNLDQVSESIVPENVTQNSPSNIARTPNSSSGGGSIGSIGSSVNSLPEIRGMIDEKFQAKNPQYSAQTQMQMQTKFRNNAQNSPQYIYRSPPLPDQHILYQKLQEQEQQRQRQQQQLFNAQPMNSTMTTGHLSYVGAPASNLQKSSMLAALSSPCETQGFPYPFSTEISPSEENKQTITCNSPTKYPEANRQSKEGQRVYRLMFETGTEGIWDQFFAQPYKLDEI